MFIRIVSEDVNNQGNYARLLYGTYDFHYTYVCMQSLPNLHTNSLHKLLLLQKAIHTFLYLCSIESALFLKIDSAFSFTTNAFMNRSCHAASITFVKPCSNTMSTCFLSFNSETQIYKVTVCTLLTKPF
jgi:hypothetical protein